MKINSDSIANTLDGINNIFMLTMKQLLHSPSFLTQLFTSAIPILAQHSAAAAAITGRETLLLDRGWLFHEEIFFSRSFWEIKCRITPYFPD